MPEREHPMGIFNRMLDEQFETYSQSKPKRVADMELDGKTQEEIERAEMHLWCQIFFAVADTVNKMVEEDGAARVKRGNI